MIARNAKLDNAERRDDEQQRKESDDAQVHCRSRNSALKPGPNAAARAMSPGLSGALLEPLLKNEENGGAGEIADVGESVPRGLRVGFLKAERDFDVAEK